MELFQNKKPKFVTRFVGRKSEIDKKANCLDFSAFYRPDNMKYREVSVFKIYKKDTNEKIFEIGDKKVFKKHGTIARGDLKVEDIEKIELQQEKLKLHWNIYSRHCNIKPFPKDPIVAQHISTQLAKISVLRERDNK